MPSSLIPTLSFFYVLLGAVFCLAERVRGEEVPLSQSAMTLIAWPFFAPFILSQALTASPETSLAPLLLPEASRASSDALERAQQRVAHAVAMLDPMTQEILANSLDQVAHAVTWGKSMQSRAMSLYHLSQSPEFDPNLLAILRTELLAQGIVAGDPRLQSVEGRAKNIQQLRHMHEQANGEVERIVLCLDELATQVVLMQFGEACGERPRLDELTSLVAGLCQEDLSSCPAT